MKTAIVTTTINIPTFLDDICKNSTQYNHKDIKIIVIVIVIKFIMNDPVNRLIGNIAIKKLRVIKVLLLNEIKFIISRVIMINRLIIIKWLSINNIISIISSIPNGPVYFARWNISVNPIYI